MSAPAEERGIDSVLKEQRTFPPPSSFAEHARVGSLAEYEQLYRRSVEDPEGFWSEQAGTLGNRVSAIFVDLPVGEASPLVRLHRVSYAMKAHKDSGQSVGADALISLSGFAPPTIHSAAARLASGLTSRLFNVVVTNVPGPQYPLYTGGAQLLEVWPFAPLYPSMGLGVALVSYNGGLFFGLTADPAIVPDVEDFARHLREAAAASLQLA